MNIDWKAIVKNVAPVLGTALGGPLAGAATKFIADKFLGRPDASEEEVAHALTIASPDRLMELKKLDYDFELEMKRLDVDVFKIQADDRADARNRQKTLKDITPAILAYLSIAFLVFATIFFSEQGWAEGEINVWFNIATLATIAWTYFFGDSNNRPKQ